MDIIASTEFNGYTVVGTIGAGHVWRVAGDQGTMVAYQSGGTHPVTGDPRWNELAKGEDATGRDLYKIV